MRSLRPTPPAPVVRTCVGCRVRTAKSDLLRVVARDGEIVPDPQARLPGRGAYLHLSQKCFEQAGRRRAFARALRLPGPLATGALGEYLAQRCGEPGAGLPGSASRGSDKNGIAGKAGSDRDERLMRTRR
ncbi:MAG TPA: YlxR family protein [Streptosporangiaceae bacterium]|nr:YlxR family protein [Streptosporangiaceae bacterium]